MATHAITISPVFEYQDVFNRLEGELRSFFPDIYLSLIIVVSREHGARAQAKYKIKHDVIQINSNYSFRIVELSKEALTLHLMLNFESKDVSVKGEAVEMKFIQMKRLE